MTSNSDANLHTNQKSKVLTVASKHQQTLTLISAYSSTFVSLDNLAFPTSELECPKMPKIYIYRPIQAFARQSLQDNSWFVSLQLWPDNLFKTAPARQSLQDSPCKTVPARQPLQDIPCKTVHARQPLQDSPCLFDCLLLIHMIDFLKYTPNIHI